MWLQCVTLAEEPAQIFGKRSALKWGYLFMNLRMQHWCGGSRKGLGFEHNDLEIEHFAKKYNAALCFVEVK